MSNPSFRRKIVGLVVAALGVAQVATLTAVLLAAHHNVRHGIEADLAVAEGVFERIYETRFVQLGDSVRVLSSDFGFKKAVATGDAPTVLSAVENHGARAGADIELLLELDGRVVAAARGLVDLLESAQWRTLLERLRRDGLLAETIAVDGAAYQFVAVPVTAPDPVAWLVMGFALDDALSHELKELSGLDVSFVDAEANDVLASSLAGPAAGALVRALERQPRANAPGVQETPVGDETYLTRVRPLGDSGVTAVLQKSLTRELAPYTSLAWQLVAVSAAVLVVAMLAGTAVARGITEPLRRLVDAATRIGEGSYGAEIDVQSEDEIGRLAQTLNTMQFEIAEREHRIVHQAHHDDLTGLPNRWLVNDRLNGAINRARRSGKAFTVVMLDLQRFKQINDSLGHHIGDVVLKEIARRLLGRARRSDTIARLGGDDFCLVLEASDLASSRAFIDGVREDLTRPIDLDGMTVSMDFTAGMAAFPDHADTPEALLRRSEIAMYDAKAAHEKVVIYEPGRDEGHLRQLAIVSHLPGALADGQLKLHYQPKANLADGRVVAAEALVRWIHPQFGFIPPDEFVTVIEQSGNISLLTNWVIEQAARQARQWLDRGLHVAVSVNLSALDLTDETLAERLARVLRVHGLAPEQLGLEITESAIMRDPRTALAVLSALRGSGFKLAIDDFGTGYSSLAQLKRLPVDELKIDKSFVMDLKGDSEDAVIVKSTIELAHSMGLSVVAEGVETPAAWSALNLFGCDVAQGYLISKPLPAEEFERWMRALADGSGRFLVEAA